MKGIGKAFSIGKSFGGGWSTRFAMCKKKGAWQSVANAELLIQILRK